jgi:hypothetical protein
LPRVSHVCDFFTSATRPAFCHYCTVPVPLQLDAFACFCWTSCCSQTRQVNLILCLERHQPPQHHKHSSTRSSSTLLTVYFSPRETLSPTMSSPKRVASRGSTPTTADIYGARHGIPEEIQAALQSVGRRNRQGEWRRVESTQSRRLQSPRLQSPRRTSV